MDTSTDNENKRKPSYLTPAEERSLRRIETQKQNLHKTEQAIWL